MPRPALFLARKDAWYLLKTRETIFWTFLMPIVFFFFIGTITGGFGGGVSEEADPLAVEIPEDAGFLAGHLEQRLRELGYRVLDPSDLGPDSNAPRLVIPPAFTDSVLLGETRTLELHRKKGGLGADYDAFRIQRAVFGLLGDLVTAAEGGHAPSPEALRIVSEMPRPLTLEVVRAGTRREIPSGFEQAVPGTMVMFTLLVLLTSGAVLLVIERKQGLLRRLASTPLARREIIAGKWGGRMILGLIQLGFAMLVGSTLFGMDWGPHLLALIVVLVTYAGLVALLGILLGNLARTEGQAVGIGVLASNLLAALGGCWWPIEITPDWMQRLALFLPTGWAMNALHKLVSFGAPATSVVPHVLTMLVASLVVGWVAARTFRFQ